MQFGPYSLNISTRLVFEDLKIDTKNQSIVHFWGENGTGKSTVMDLIVKDLILEKVSFAFINQNYRQSWLWWYSPKKNLELALGKKIDLETFESTEIFKSQKWLKSLIFSNPKQVNFSKENELEAIGLSGGQLQRIIIFREILRNPKFILLDEAFSALDKKVYTELIEWLLEIQKKLNFKIISICHNKDIISKMGGKVLYFKKDLQTFNLKILENE
jgi:ABC-type Mn2+/Zn2+ transport system ATPase subunit